MIKKRSALSGLLMCLLPVLASAVDDDGYYIYKPDWSGGSGSWADGSRWYDGVAPAEGCKVKIGNAATADVSDSDMALLQSLSEIRLHTTNAVIRFNVSGDYHIPYPIYHYGKIVKNGSGSLYLESTSAKAYETTHGIVVNEGALYLPAMDSAVATDHYVGPLTVNSPGRLYLFDGCPTVSAGLSGDGAISNLSEVATSETYRRLKITGGSSSSPYEFSGILGNNISYMNYGGHQYFRRDNDTSSRTVRLYSGTLGLSAMSCDSGDSISKEASFHIRGSGSAEMRLRYIGDGDGDLTHELLLYDDAKNFVLDSGSSGSLSVNGSFKASRQAGKMTRFTLAGDSANRNFFNVPVLEDVDGVYATYLIKNGPGVWRMTSSANQLNGVVEVQEGTLEITSLAERGELCALGRQNILHENYVGERDDAKAVDYAILLGDGTDEISTSSGTLAYVGESDAVCSTRPIAISGCGRLSGDGDAIFDWSGVSPLDAGDASLVLAGSSSKAVVRSATDGDGRLSVVKEGAGTWKMSGSMKITGAVESRGGSLLVANGRRFKWYRFNIRDTWKNVCVSNGVTGTDNAVQLRGFALIAADNLASNVMYGAIYNSAANGNPAMLAPGEVCYANAANVPVLEGRDLNKLFAHSLFQAVASVSKPDIDPVDEGTWIRIAMRVPEGTAEIVKYDIRSGTNGSATTNAAPTKVPYCREVRSWSIEGSSDGETWECIVSEDRTVDDMTPLSNSQWYSSASSSMNGFNLGFAGYQSLVKDIRPSSIGVAGGGLLSFEERVEVSELKLNATSGGVISNVSLLPNGTIDVAAPKGFYGELQVVFNDVSGLANLAGYELTINGGTTKSKLSQSGGTLKIVPPGMTIHIR